MAWALMIILTLDTAMPPQPSWHPTRQDCEAHAAMRVYHYELTGRPVSWVGCQRVQLPQAVRAQTFKPQLDRVP